LKEPGRVTVKNGVTYVLIRRTETRVELLCGLDKMGIAPKLATPAEMQALGLNLPTKTVTVTKLSPWSWLLPLIILALLALYLWFRRDPTRVGAGRVNENGVQTPQAAAEHVRNQIALAAQAAGNHVLPAQVRIINMVRGRVYGFARIGDRLGSFFPRILHGEEAWEVTTQRPNGTQEIRYTLLACANDVRAGGGMIPLVGFRFVPGTNVTAEVQPVVVPAPAPVPPPAPAPVAPEPPAAHEVPAPVPITRAAALPEGMVRFEFKRATDGQPNVVRLQGVVLDDFFFETGPTATTFRYRETLKEPAPAPAPAAPETPAPNASN
jgi:hypothetical protein